MLFWNQAYNITFNRFWLYKVTFKSSCLVALCSKYSVLFSVLEVWTRKNHIKKLFWDMQDIYILLEALHPLFFGWRLSYLSSELIASCWLPAEDLHTECMQCAGFCTWKWQETVQKKFHSCSVSGLRIYSRGPLQFIFSPLEIDDTCYLVTRKLFLCWFLYLGDFHWVEISNAGRRKPLSKSGEQSCNYKSLPVTTYPS